MKFFATILLFVATAAAGGGHPGTPKYDPCPNDLLNTPQCCDADALGVLAVGCVPPPTGPTSAHEFNNCCRASSRRPRCCAITALGLAVLCEDAAGL